MDRDRVSSDLISGQARAADRNPCHYLCSGSEVGSIKEQHLHDREDLCPSLQPFVRVVCSKMCNLGSVAGPTATSRSVCRVWGGQPAWRCREGLDSTHSARPNTCGNLHTGPLQQ